MVDPSQGSSRSEQKVAGRHPRHDKQLLQRQIGAADAAIDTLVSTLYGLTEEEIGIVAGK